MDTTAPARRKQPRVSARVIDDATVEAVMEHGKAFLAIARRHSATPLDADDAFQRSVETLITKAPTTDVAVLVRWMTVVVRNEALAVARDQQRTSHSPLSELADVVESPQPGPAEQYDLTVQLEQRIEALHRVTSDETRCLLLRAEGLSYEEIAQRTGFTERKVSRCLWKGRGKLTGRITDIESGTECERIEPLLSLVVDGDAAAALEARPHLRNCSGCRATLREYRVAPQRLAAALPIAGLVTAESSVDQLIGGVDRLLAGFTERFNAHFAQAQQWLEAGSAKKVTAVVAASAALAGGGALATGSMSTAGTGLRPVAQRLGVSSINDVAARSIGVAPDAAVDASTESMADSTSTDDRSGEPRPTSVENPGLLAPEGQSRGNSREPATQLPADAPGAGDTGTGDLTP